MSLSLQLRDYRLTTAEILYRMPDHPGVLQSYLWQELDLAPKFPELRRFLQFWNKEIEGKLHSIHIASTAILQPGRIAYTDHLMTLQ